MQGLRVNKKLIAHGTYVMYTIGMLVDHLEDPETLEQMLKRLARNHYRRKVQITAFELLRDTFIEHLADIFSPELFTKKTAIAWHKAFGYILNVLDREFNTLDIDIQKRSSYHQLNNTQRTARNDMIQSYLKSYRVARNNQNNIHSNLLNNQFLSVKPSLSRLQFVGLGSPSVASSSGSISHLSSSASSTTPTGKTKDSSTAKRTFRFVFKPFKMVRKSLKRSSSSSKLDR